MKSASSNNEKLQFFRSKKKKMLHGILGFSVGAGSVAILYETLLKNRGGSNNKTFTPPPPAAKLESSSTQQQTLQSSSTTFPPHILPSTTEELFVAPGNAYLSNFSSFLRTPRWVLEVFEADKIFAKKNSSLSLSDSGDRTNSKFFSNESSGIAENFRASNADYTVKPGLSRGHLAAAQFHKGSQQEMDATFDLSLNIVPQDMTVNACDWFRLEQMSKSLCKDFTKLFVLTGPAFVPEESSRNNKLKQMKYELVGEHQVAVPTHMFKCLLGQDKKNANNYALGCFLLPNKPISNERPLTSFLVQPQDLEKITGVKVFSGILHPSSKSSPSSSWYPLCSKHKCEGSYGSFSKNFRQIGVLRSCQSKQELDAEWRRIQKEYDASGQAIESSLAKEYQNRLKNFA